MMDVSVREVIKDELPLRLYTSLNSLLRDKIELGITHRLWKFHNEREIISSSFMWKAIGEFTPELLLSPIS
jgi:hypothetical protein